MSTFEAREGPWDARADWSNQWFDLKQNSVRPVPKSLVDQCVFAWQRANEDERDNGSYAAIFALTNGRFVAYEGTWDVTGSSFHQDAYGGDAIVYVVDSFAEAMFMVFGDRVRERILQAIRAGHVTDPVAVRWLAMHENEPDVAYDWLLEHHQIKVHHNPDLVYVIVETTDGPLANTDVFEKRQQTIKIPNFSGNAHIRIMQRTSNRELRQIIVSRMDQISAFFTIKEDRAIRGHAYDAYVSINPLIGEVIGGRDVTLIRPG